jgi:hypothetical protein
VVDFLESCDIGKPASPLEVLLRNSERIKERGGCPSGPT